MSTTVEKHYTVLEAAEVSGMSESAIKRAINATEGHVLRAKHKPSRNGTGPGRGYVIPASALAEFLEGLDEA
jgi:hypothetical protein